MDTISKRRKNKSNFMIQFKIKELKEIIKLIDLRNSSDISIESHKKRRDQLISELEEEMVKLNDFDNWKEWKNFQIIK